MSNIKKEFDHPCKQTCSGWRQGFDRGLEQSAQRIEELEKLAKALEVAESALKYMTEDYDCDAEDVARFDKRKAEQALSQIEKIKNG